MSLKAGNIAQNEILIETKACGICGSDVECFLGESDAGRYDIAPYTSGAMEEYLEMQEKFVHKIPDDWSYEEGALVEPLKDRR